MQPDHPRPRASDAHAGLRSRARGAHLKPTAVIIVVARAAPKLAARSRLVSQDFRVSP
jgi:hypothetical protein